MAVRTEAHVQQRTHAVMDPALRTQRAQNPAAVATNNSPVVVHRTPHAPKVAGTLGQAYDDYQKQLERGVTINPKYQPQLAEISKMSKERVQQLDTIAQKANLPRELVAALWSREDAGMNRDIYLHNGQQLGKATTEVPKGIFFRKDQFVDAAVHALQQKRELANQLGLHRDSKDVAAMSAFAEAYNGFGYRNMRRPSAYVNAGTDTYQSGMYTSDGRFNPRQVDTRPGALPTILRLMQDMPR